MDDRGNGRSARKPNPPNKKDSKITHASTLKLEMNFTNLSYFTNCITFPVYMEQSCQQEVIFRLVGLQGFLSPRLQPE
jgi:hypothetical protein